MNEKKASDEAKLEYIFHHIDTSCVADCTFQVRTVVFGQCGEVICKGNGSAIWSHCGGPYCIQKNNGGWQSSCLLHRVRKL